MFLCPPRIRPSTSGKLIHLSAPNFTRKLETFLEESIPDNERNLDHNEEKLLNSTEYV